MGLRSPQELEIVKGTRTQTPMVEAAKTATIDLAEPANQYLTQRSLASQIEAQKAANIEKKKATSRVSSKYALDNATAEFQVQLTEMKNNTALKEGDKYLANAIKAIEDLEAQAPEALKQVFAEEKTRKITELTKLKLTKQAQEGRNALIHSGDVNSKNLTMLTASNFMDKDALSRGYSKVYQNAFDVGMIKGLDETTNMYEATTVASNAVVEGVNYSLNQAATPDAVDRIEQYYKNSIITESEGVINVTEADQNKIAAAFVKARRATKENFAWYLADKAKDMPADEAYKYIFNNARNDSDVVASANRAYEGFSKAKQNAVDANDRKIMAQIQGALNSGRLTDLPSLERRLSPEGQTKARALMDNFTAQGGGVSVYTDPKDYRELMDMAINNPAQLATQNLDERSLAPSVRKNIENLQMVFGNKEFKRKFDITNGALDKDADRIALEQAASIMGRRVYRDPSIKKQVLDTARAIRYNTIANHISSNKTDAQMLGLIKQAYATDLMESRKERTKLGAVINAITPWDPEWGKKEVIEVRPESDFRATPQTGLGAQPSPITGKTVPEPRPAELERIKRLYKQNKNQELTDEQAKQVYEDTESARLKGN